MRILVVNYEYPPIGGGGGFFTRDLYEEIVRQGHDATVITSRYADLPSREVLNGVDVIRVPILARDKLTVASLPSMLSYPPAVIFKALSGLGPGRFDVINTHFAIPSGPAGYTIAKWMRRPNVLSVHGGDIYDPSKRLSPHRIPLLRRTVRLTIKTADCVVAQSDDTRNNVHQFYDRRVGVDIIPLGIRRPLPPRSVSRQGLGRELGLKMTDDDFVFCTIGRLIKRKNLAAAINALAAVESKRQMKLLIIGEGPERSALTYLIRELGLETRAHLLGAVSDSVKFNLLALCDGYLSSAMHEGFGLVFLEAMAFGVPVICYDRGGQIDFLTNRQTGFVVPLGDRQQLTRRIKHLVEQDGLRQQMAGHCRKVVEGYFIEACARRYLGLFADVIAAHKSDPENKNAKDSIWN